MKEKSDMSYFPMFINLEGTECLVAGGGRIAYRKVLVLREFGAIITVAAGEICEELELLSVEKHHGEQPLKIVKRDFEAGDVAGKRLVVAATDDKTVNHRISQICRKQGIMVNAVDAIEDCDFIFPSYQKQGEVVGAFSSGGQSPVMTQYLKQYIGKVMTPFLGELAEYLGSIRETVKKNVDTESERKEIYQKLLQAGIAEGKKPEKLLQELLEEKKKRGSYHG
jgi:uroporphyrin-III C-methyltransferase/precorrin-2 dehydrogenase/sirohydrochlorin ferrochelatase/precorrin-2 dehydrogenase/sirohydrochlorin ferrochelatase